MTPLSLRECLQDAAAKLTGCVDQPYLEAEMLLCFVLKQPRSYLFAHPEIILSHDALAQFTAYLARRLALEPIAYITGKRSFWNADYAVSQATLIPRPETELLVETVLKEFPDKMSKRSLADLGTGSGAIVLAIASERPYWSCHATDSCSSALAQAKQNAQQHQLEQVIFHQGHWCQALPPLAFDIIVSNPPYLATLEWACYASGLQYEPYHALVSGVSGLEAIAEIVQTAGAYLKPNGCLCIEHGFAQGQAVRDLFKEANYTAIRSIRDYLTHERLTLGYLG